MSKRHKKRNWASENNFQGAEIPYKVFLSWVAHIAMIIWLLPTQNSPLKIFPRNSVPGLYQIGVPWSHMWGNNTLLWLDLEAFPQEVNQQSVKGWRAGLWAPKLIDMCIIRPAQPIKAPSPQRQNKQVREAYHFLSLSPSLSLSLSHTHMHIHTPLKGEESGLWIEFIFLPAYTENPFCWEEQTTQSEKRCPSCSGNQI